MATPIEFASPAKRLRAFLLLLAAIGTAVLACYDSVPTSPGSKSVPPVTPRRDVQPLPAKEKGLPPTPGTRVFIETYPFTEQVIVEGKITGSVQITSDALARWQVNESRDYRGYSQSSTLGTQCAVSAYFAWGNSASPGMPCSAGNPASTWIDTIRVMDSVWAVRGPPISESSGQCGVGVPCHDYPSATTTLTLTPLAAALKDSVYPAFWTQAQMLDTYTPMTHFRARADPSGFHGLSTPTRFLHREWHKADPSVGAPSTPFSGYCADYMLVCDVYVRESGIYFERQRVNGVEREDSVAVNCSVGDSLMDFLEARRAYLDAMDSSHADASNHNDRKEHVLVIVEDSAGGLHAVPVPTDPAGTTQCTAKYTSLRPEHGYGKLRAYVHTHPFRTGNEMAQCVGSTKLEPTRPGLSDTDYKYMQRSNKFIKDSLASAGWQPVPWYAMDKNYVFRLKPGKRLSESTKAENTFKWKSGRCKWARPTNSQVPGYLGAF